MCASYSGSVKTHTTHAPSLSLCTRLPSAETHVPQGVLGWEPDQGGEKVASRLVPRWFLTSPGSRGACTRVTSSNGKVYYWRLLGGPALTARPWRILPQRTRTGKRGQTQPSDGASLSQDGAGWGGHHQGVRNKREACSCHQAVVGVSTLSFW